MTKKIKKIIGFIGAGNMAEALIKGMLRKKILSAENIHASDVSPERLTKIKDETGINIYSRNMSVLEAADIIILAVKPQHIKTVLEEISHQTGKKTVVSIAAGISVECIKSVLGIQTPVVRVMPNTAALVGEAMTGLVVSPEVTGTDKEAVKSMFASVGKIAEVSEDMMNIVTALSGSGPAYIFYMAEALIRAAQNQGVSPELAKMLVNQTILGAAKMLTDSAEGPEELRVKVTSPGGTTEAGLAVMKEHRFEDLMDKTLAKAIKRAEELLRAAGAKAKT